MKATLSISKQFEGLVRRHVLLHYLLPFTQSYAICHTSTSEQPVVSPLSQHQDNELVITQVVQLLKNSEKDWNNDPRFHSLIFSDSNSSVLSPRSLFQIARRLDSSSKALNFLSHVKGNTQSHECPSLSLPLQGVLEVASGEPKSELKLLELYKTSKEMGISLNVPGVIILMRTFIKAGMMDESFRLLNEINQDLKHISVYNVLIRGLVRSGRIDCALEVFEEMLQPEVDVEPDDVTGDVIFELLCRRQQPGRDVNGQRVVELVRKLGEHGVFPDTLRLTQMITKLCKNHKSTDAWEVLHDVMRLGCVVEAAPCNALLTGLGKQRDFARLNKFLVKMKEMNIQSDVLTFGIIINQLCKARKVNEALQVFGNMKGQDDGNDINVEPDVIIFNTLIDGLCKVDRQDEGLELMQQMRTRESCAPNTVTYNCLIHGYCKVGDLDKAMELFNRMTEQGAPPSVVTINTLVDGMCKHGRISSAIQFFEKMQSQGLKGNEVTYASLITKLCGMNNINKAMELFQEMLNSGFSADAIVYYSLISGLSIAGRMDDASFVVLKSKEAGCGLDVACYNVLISGFCEKNQVDKINETLKDMKATDVKPDRITYNTLLSYSIKYRKFATAHRVMKRMIKDDIVPTITTYGAMINAYCLTGNVSEAMNLYKEMTSTLRVAPNISIYNILIESNCDNGDVGIAVLLMEDMEAKGVLPDTTTYNVIFKGFRDNNMLQKAFEFTEKMTRHGCSPDHVTMEVLTEWLSAVGKIKRLKKFTNAYQVLASALQEQ